MSNSLSLTDFIKLINNMPIDYQAFTSKKETWRSYLQPEIEDIFDKKTEIKISRKDIKEIATTNNLKKLIIATIIWGYPRGMRGNHFENIVSNINILVELLLNVKKKTILDWTAHYKEIKKIPGLGLSTYTKFLYFLSISVEGKSPLILDDRIINVVALGIFKELKFSKKLTYQNASSNYLEYLILLDSIAKDLNTTAEKLEFFLFQFGLNLK